MNESMWERAQAAFDARRDPLRDAELAGAPEELAQLVALRAVLATLERPRRRRRVALRVAAAALLLGLVGAFALRGERAQPASPTRVASEAGPPRPVGRVLALSMTTTTRSGRETRVARSDGRTLRRELRAAAEAPPEAGANALLTANLTATLTR